MAFTSSIPTRTKLARRQPRNLNSRWVLIAAEILVPIILLAWWWVASANANNTFFPPLSNILERMWVLMQTPVYWSNVGSSMGNLVISFVLATLLGILFGIALGLSRALSFFVEPTVHFFRAIPPVALIPIFVSLIGFGNETRIVSITLAAFFPILISTMDGVRSIEPTLVMVSKVYRLTPLNRLVNVVLPAASPRILSGMQVSLMAAFVVMIASEMLGSSNGLGAATLLAQQTFAITDMWVGILTLGLLGYGTTALFVLFRARILNWYIASQQQEKNS